MSKLSNCKIQGISRVWWFGSLEELWYLMIGPIQSSDEAKFADVEKAPSQNVATCRQNVATCRQTVEAYLAPLSTAWQRMATIQQQTMRLPRT